MSISGVFSLSGRPGKTVAVSSTDGPQYLPAEVLKDVDGSPAKAVLITVETNDIRFALGGTIANITPSRGHVLAAGGSARLSHPIAVSSFSFCSKTASSAGVLQITGEY